MVARRLVAIVVVGLVTIAGTVTAGAQPTDDEPTSDELTPLLVDPLSSPIPVRGSDNRIHVAYELKVLNASPRPGTLERIETIDRATGDVVGSIDGEEIAQRIVRVGPLPLESVPSNDLAPGETVTIVIDDTYDDRADVPRAFEHRFVASFAPPPPGQNPVAAMYPDEVDAVLDTMRLGRGQPLRIAPPLAGDGWLAANGCCTLSPHRGSMMPFAGRINATERYAIDWIKVQPERVGSPDVPEGLLPSFEGDPTLNESYLAYDEPLFAVADGTVAVVVDDIPDSTPQQLPEGLTIQQLGGSYVILDLGDGFYAFYAHAKPGSVTVKVGDRVERGQVIARLGNSGNSTEAHLHFHISRGPTPLASTNWPYEITRFDVRGTLGDDGLVDEPTPGPRRNELPLALNVVDFPTR